MESGNYYRLLRESRLMALPKAIGKRTEEYYPTHQIIRSPLSSHFRGNWGLKRDLQQVKTSYISIDSLDTLEHQTPFESGNSKIKFFERWKEMRVQLYVKKMENDDTRNIKGFRRIHKIPFSPFAPIEVPGKDALHKNISDMTLKEFKKYIQKLETKKERFIEFMQQQEESLSKEQHVGNSPLSRSIGIPKNHLLVNKYIEKFLNIPTNNQKIPKTLPNAGLDYYPNGYLSPVTDLSQSRKKLFPARVLSLNPNDRKVFLCGIVAYVLGKNPMPKFINGVKDVREGLIHVIPKFAQISPEGKLGVYVKFADTINNHRPIQHKTSKNISERIE